VWQRRGKQATEKKVAAEELAIRLLGTFDISYQGQSLPALQADRPQSLLAYLLLHRHAPQSRRHLAFLLWPDSGEAQALNNLRNLLHTLRRALPDADRYLAIDKTTLQWRPELPIYLDIAKFEAALVEGQQSADRNTARRRLEESVALYQGPLMPANYDDWLVPLRDELDGRYQSALRDLIELLARGGAYPAAATYAQRLVQLDPLDEGHTVRLMRLYAQAGDRNGVRRAYQACLIALRKELGVEPEPETKAAYENLLRQAAVSEAPSSMPEDTPKPRPLPTSSTPFVGRQVELHEIGQLLADPHCRLLTITGPGGIGKTRVAVETALNYQAHFPDGVACASLRALNSADFLPAAVAHALNLTLAGQLDTTTQLLRFLGSKKVLIILDNFEHHLDSVGLITNILEQTSAVKLLVTSRQRLNTEEEWSFALGELILPVAASPQEMARSSAVTLFVQSARRAASSFKLTGADYPAVVQICRLVGGLPLGIILAASWTRLLSCAEIAQELERGMDFLTVTTRNVPAQHQSLRAVFDQSWELLTAAERQLLQALAVFPDSFTRQAAAAASGATLQDLWALTDKSLLRRVDLGRYSLHELIRQYGRERLHADAEFWAEVQGRHGRYFLTHLAGSESLLFSGQRGPIFAELSVDIGNLRAAWEWGLEQQQWQLLNRATRAYVTFYELHSWNQEALSTLARTIERLQPLAEQSDDPALHMLLGGALSSRGWFHFRCGQMAAARVALDDGLALIRSVTDQATERGLQFALHQLGMVAFVSGDYAAAQAALIEVLALNRKLADEWGIAYALAVLGMVRFAQGQAQEGYTLLIESVAVWRRNGAPRLGVFSLSFFGTVALGLGHHGPAAEALEEGLALAQNAGDRYGVATILRTLAALHLAQKEYEQAEAAVQRSLAIFQEIGDSWRVTQAQALLGSIYQAQGRFSGAEEAFRQAHETAVAASAMPYAVEALISLAELWAQIGRREEALNLAQEVQAHPAGSRQVQSRAGKLLEMLV
jgi:DNA-binding SARP family transcriptional activator/predicted ATPase